ncbi:sensor histidine kinase [Phycicoccus endophyticus]|uniref:histidine kinase n=2 Tax=Phycicoccus endophyticus TaxID=1690220 RepID=A0A7G9R655_9MICO|nr:sensor histidine kinase [Phycicoccus endophyticus]QNN51080.1 sensor histidine kinase [Phycicoccus endophyticus]GGL38792.1 histidine kinase [Phycicoccus endophyticus]
MSVAGQTALLVVALVFGVIAAGLGAAYLQARRAVTERSTAQVLAVARSVAAEPDVVEAVRTGDPGGVLEPIAEGVRRSTGTDFVVVMSPDGIRYSHPNPAQVGRRFVGHIAAARAGGTVVEDYTGTLGPSRRVVVPVRDDDGPVVGLVSVGIGKEAVNARLAGELPPLLAAGAVAGVLAAVGSTLITRRVRRQTRGLRAAQLQAMHDHHDAVLHSVTEGLVLLDPAGRVRLANDEARRLLRLGGDPAGRAVADLGLPATLVAAMSDADVREDDLHVHAGRVLVLNKARARRGGEDLGAVVTIRDRTDLEELTGELGAARGLAEALRSQAHESGNRLHTMVSLIELGHPERAVEFATGELDRAQRLTDVVLAGVEDPTLSALLLGKAAEAHERGVELVVDPALRWPAGLASARDVVTVVGNLVDNALDAVAGAEGERRVDLSARDLGDRLELVVADTGPGIPDVLRERVLERGFSTKPGGEPGSGRGIGLALVHDTVQRLGGSLAIAGPPGARVAVTLPLEGGGGG